MGDFDEEENALTQIYGVIWRAVAAFGLPGIAAVVCVCACVCEWLVDCMFAHVRVVVDPGVCAGRMSLLSPLHFFFFFFFFFLLFFFFSPPRQAVKASIQKKIDDKKEEV